MSWSSFPGSQSTVNAQRKTKRYARGARCEVDSQWPEWMAGLNLENADQPTRNPDRMGRLRSLWHCFLPAVLRILWCMHERIVSSRVWVSQGGDAAAMQDCGNTLGGGE